MNNNQLNIEQQILDKQASIFSDLLSFSQYNNFDIEEILKNNTLKEIFNFYLKQNKQNDFITAVFNNIYKQYKSDPNQNYNFRDFWKKSFNNTFNYFNNIDGFKLSKENFTKDLFLYLDPQTKDNQRTLLHPFSAIYFLNNYFSYFDSNDKIENTKIFLKTLKDINIFSPIIITYGFIDFNFLDKLDFNNKEMIELFNHELFITDKHTNCVKNLVGLNLYESYNDYFKRIAFIDKQMNNDFLKDIYINGLNSYLEPDNTTTIIFTNNYYSNNKNEILENLDYWKNNINIVYDVFNNMISLFENKNNTNIFRIIKNNFKKEMMNESCKFFNHEAIEFLNKKKLLNDLLNHFVDFHIKLNNNKNYNFNLNVIGFSKKENFEFNDKIQNLYNATLEKRLITKNVLIKDKKNKNHSKQIKI